MIKKNKKFDVNFEKEFEKATYYYDELSNNKDKYTDVISKTYELILKFNNNLFFNNIINMNFYKVAQYYKVASDSQFSFEVIYQLNKDINNVLILNFLINVDTLSKLFYTIKDIKITYNTSINTFLKFENLDKFDFNKDGYDIILEFCAKLNKKHNSAKLRSSKLKDII